MRGLVCVPPGRVSVIGVPVLLSAFSMASAVALGQAERMAAIAPATCGAAIEVPLKQAIGGCVADDVPGTTRGCEDWMLKPGASQCLRTRKSTTADILEKDETTSAFVVAPTATADRNARRMTNLGRGRVVA